ncbi:MULTISPECIES: hypothetical protein [unclassified Halorhodospira]|uniref:hypothetical protein n=1 Tax=unclassified Halorhodospira TaxID=2626748 RepID=UPI001EE8F3C2|nr:MULTISPECIES: hypothetical protein [unclassified Halorhodospira]MCG5540836.1 hypothetical protein [Halorhodospira sp. M39old]MCG5546076.1 hypothetical protein [Halorhodospira sp. M38]
MRELSDITRIGAWGLPLLALIVVLGASLSIIPKDADAVPSHSRQTGQPCSACHTQPPRLTEFGREFQISGYTMGAEPELEQANIFENMPISGRLRGDIDYNEEDESEVRPKKPDVRLYFSGRLTDHVGLYTRLDSDGIDDAKVTIADEFGDYTLGFAGGNVGFGRADPYDTLGRGGGFQLQRNLAIDAGRADLRGAALRNRGTGGTAYLHGNNIYLAAGAYDLTGDEGELEDFGVRAAYELPFADSHVGVHWLTAEEDYEGSDGLDDGSRVGLDAAAQWSLNEDWLADVQGVVVYNEQEIWGDTEAAADTDLGEDYDVDHWGWSISTALHRGPWAYGVNFGQYIYDDDYYVEDDGLVESPEVTSVNPFISWMFAENARLGVDVEYLDNEIPGFEEGEFDYTRARIRYDIGF